MAARVGREPGALSEGGRRGRTILQCTVEEKGRREREMERGKEKKKRKEKKMENGKKKRKGGEREKGEGGGGIRAAIAAPGRARARGLAHHAG